MQLLFLRLRYRFGWGNDPLMLKYRAIWRGLWVRCVILILGMGTAFIFAIWWMSGTSMEKLFSSSSGLLLLYSCGAIAAVTFQLTKRRLHHLAQEAEDAGVEAISGECYIVLPADPSRLFAKIGPTPTQAKWYAMPIQWDTSVKPGSGTVTFEAYQPTRCATRLLSVSTRQLDRTAPSESEQAPLETLRRHNATPEMWRYVRKDWLRGWAVPSRVAFWCGVGSLVFFVTFGLEPVYFFLAPVLSPIDTFQEALTYSLAFSPFALIGWPSLAWSIAIIRTGRRGMRARSTPVASTEGVVTLALEHRDPFCRVNRASAYVQFEADGGTSRVFRIPSELAHRVPPGGRVRITYTPATEVVTDVTLLEPEAIAV